MIITTMVIVFRSTEPPWGYGITLPSTSRGFTSGIVIIGIVTVIVSLVVLAVIVLVVLVVLSVLVVLVVIVVIVIVIVMIIREQGGHLGNCEA